MMISRRSTAPPSRTGAVCHWENQRARMPPDRTQLIGCPKDEVLLRGYWKCVLRINGSDSAGIHATMSTARPPEPRSEDGVSMRDRRLDRLRQFFLRGQWNNRAIERQGDHFVHRFDEVELHFLAHVRRDVLEIALVFRRQDDLRQPGPRRGKNLVLHPAHRKDFPPQGD